MSEVTSGNRVIDAIWSVMRRRIIERGVAATELGDHMLHGLGKIHRSDHELIAGGRTLNDNTELLGRLARASSLGIALYMGNRRIASTAIIDAGHTAERGGYADAVLVDAVLRKREVFKGSLMRDDRPTIVVARPLYTTSAPDDHGPIGFIEAFQDEQTILEIMAVSTRAGRDQQASALQKHADGMGAVIDFLDDVARRLQLLALNGNIIASQAGEQGRAFRVVCRELGTLADRAKGTVTDVRKLMHAMGLDSPEERDMQVVRTTFGARIERDDAPPDGDLSSF
ncbi:MAG: hypothetical protein KC636_19005 [Myxococcales bacterium]|nr:hypothetical protein [Myxococcales bacterium]